MRARKVRLVFWKDWLEVRRNWQILLPVIVIPFMFAVVLPILVMAIPSLSPTSTSQQEDPTSLIRALPADVSQELQGMTAQQALFYIMSLYFFAPFFLVVPLMASSVIASDSFAGEKERKTMETLFATPLSDGELFLGKVLVAFIPSMVVTVVSFLVYSTIVNMVSYVTLSRILLPNTVWIMLIFGVAPEIALAGIGLTVMISTRVKGFREAQQISALLLIPILMLVFGQLSGAMLLGPAVVASLIAVFGILDVLLFYIGIRTFKREEILSKIA
jgi:ABC-type Na+ efflux pump permease subunit